MGLPILAVACILAAVPVQAGAQDADKAREPLVRVNGHTITSEDLDRQLGMAGSPPAPGGGTMTALESDEVELQRERMALRELVDAQLLYDRARREYLADPSAEQALERVAEEQMRKLEERAGSMLKARLILADLGLSVEQYKELQGRNWLAAKLMWDKALSRAHVSPAESRAYYTQHQSEFSVPRTIVFRQILFTTADEDDAAAVLAEAQAVLEQIRGGADFAELADRHSADAAGYPGGLHRAPVPDPESTWMPPIVVDLAPGQVTDVRRVDGGYAIGRLETVQPPRTAPFGDVQEDIKATLLRRKRVAVRASFLNDLRREAEITFLAGAKQLLLD